MRRTLLIALSSGLIFWSPVDGGAVAGSGQYAGIVATWKGNVYIYREGEPERIRVEETIPVQQGDIITTDMESAVKILMADDSVVAVADEGSLDIERLTIEDGVRRLSLRLVSGVVRIVVGRYFQPDESYIELKSPAALVRVEGTDFVVNSMDDATEVVSLDGTVEVRSIKGAGVERVGAGYMTRVEPDSPPTQPEKTPPYYLEELVARTDVPVNMVAEMRKEGCRECHRDVYADTSRYRHPAFFSNCRRCHTKETERTMTMGFKDGWGDNILFVDLEDNLPYSVTIRGRDSLGRETSSEPLKVVPSKDAEEISDDQKAPKVSLPEVVEVREGVFYFITVRWKTDKPALSYVEYGRGKKPDSVARASMHYATEHMAVIDKIKRGKKYYLRAVARDISGRKGYSKPVSVRVKRAFSRKGVRSDPPLIEGVKLVRLGQGLALRWQGSGITEGTISIGVAAGATAGKLSGPHFPGLESRDEAGLYACNECHVRDIHRRTSHPMVAMGLGKAGMLPLGSGGKMLCITCHMPHGSRYPYVLRKEETELCQSCHE